MNTEGHNEDVTSTVDINSDKANLEEVVEQLN